MKARHFFYIALVLLTMGTRLAHAADAPANDAHGTDTYAAADDGKDAADDGGDDAAATATGEDNATPDTSEPPNGEGEED